MKYLKRFIFFLKIVWRKDIDNVKISVKTAFKVVTLLYPCLFFFVGCGNGFHIPTYIQDQELKEYVNRFEVYGKFYLGNDFIVGDMSYYFENMSSNDIAGICYIEGIERKIVINSYYWLNYTDMEREELMFHELGHCRLFRQHLDDLFDDRSPKSIMHYRVMRERTYKRMYDYYVKELFTGATQ